MSYNLVDPTTGDLTQVAGNKILYQLMQAQDGNVIVVRVGPYQNNLKGLVIVEYTKTTD